jgi:hypothetical protein
MPGINAQRQQLERKLKHGARSVRTLLTRREVMARLFQYTNATGRFRKTFNDVTLPDNED